MKLDSVEYMTRAPYNKISSSSAIKASAEVLIWLMAWVASVTNFSLVDMLRGGSLLLAASQLPFVALYGLAAYLYYNSRVGVKPASPEASLKKKWLVITHLLPVVILLIGALWVYLHPGNERNISILLQYIANARIAYFVLAAYTRSFREQKVG